MEDIRTKAGRALRYRTLPADSLDPIFRRCVGMDRDPIVGFPSHPTRADDVRIVTTPNQRSGNFGPYPTVISRMADRHLNHSFLGRFLGSVHELSDYGDISVMAGQNHHSL
jgi:hypothetical protein